MTPFIPGMNSDHAHIVDAVPSEVLDLSNGDSIRLEAQLVRRTIGDRAFIMYGYNGQYPGPVLKVGKGDTIYVEYVNSVELPSTVHWHGLRLDNEFDGVPGVTQDIVNPGQSFLYRLHFPDEGIYWYHPHHREDILQEMGLYGNMLVQPTDSSYWSRVNREELLILDDLLIRDNQIAPFGLEASNFTLMGRFGNVFLTNGVTDYRLQVQRGEVVRFYVTNVSNTRIFNFDFGGAPIKVVGGDISKYQREEWVQSVTIAPAERYVVEVMFPEAGDYEMVHRIQSIDHFMGQFISESHPIGIVSASNIAVSPDLSGTFEFLRTNEDVEIDINRYRSHFERQPDFNLDLTIRAGDLPAGMIQFMSIDTAYYPPVELGNSMPMMNWISNSNNTQWVIREPSTGNENDEIRWKVALGSVLKIRIFNRDDLVSSHESSHSYARPAVPGARSKRAAHRKPGVEGDRPGAGGHLRRSPRRHNESGNMDDSLPHCGAPRGGDEHVV